MATRKTMLHLPDFEGVDDSGGNFHIPSGDYLMKCLGVSAEVSKNDNDMYVFKFEGLEKQAKGRQFRLHCTLGTNALWKLKQTLRGLGLEPPEGSTGELDPTEVEGVECIGTVTDNEYEGKISSRLSEIRAIGDEVEEDEPPPRTAAKKPATIRPPTTSKSKNGKPKLAASEVEDMQEDELFEINEKYELGVDLDAHKTTIRKRNAIIAGLQSGGMLEA